MKLDVGGVGVMSCGKGLLKCPGIFCGQNMKFSFQETVIIFILRCFCENVSF